jgi:hypothetical protein
MDPTPPAVIEARMRSYGSGWWDRVLTSGKLWWYRWVVKYSMKKQAALLLKALTGRDPGTDPYVMAAEFKRLVHGVRVGGGVAMVTALVVVLFLGLLFFAWFLFGRGKRSGTRAYFRRLERILASRGVIREPGQTPLEMASTVCERFPAACQPYRKCVKLYYRDIFGPGLTSVDKRRISELTKEILRNLNQGPDA